MSSSTRRVVRPDRRSAGPSRPAPIRPQPMRPRSSRAVCVVALVLLLVVGLRAGPVAADSTSGARARSTIAPRSGECPFRAPVDGRLVDGFRLDAGEYGPGNRGLEYASAPGDTARAVGAGVVVFAGQVAGRLVVSVDHAGGLRSSLTGLASIGVTEGDPVHRGAQLGTVGARLHLGIREGRRYLDPAALICDDGAHARLVPVPGRSR